MAAIEQQQRRSPLAVFAQVDLVALVVGLPVLLLVLVLCAIFAPLLVPLIILMALAMLFFCALGSVFA